MLRASDVTYVTPTIPGREELLHRAVLSVAQQRPAAHGVVVVLDSERHGAWWARNKGLDQVDTLVTGFLDDDDLLMENHTGVLIRAMHRTGADLVFSNANFVGGRDPLACCHNGKLVPSPINVPFGYEQQMHLDSRRFQWHSCGYLTGNFIPITYLVRTELVRRVGGFPRPYSMPEVHTSGEAEDYLLLLRLLDAGAVFHHVLGVRTWTYHFWDGNVGGRGRDRLHEIAGPPGGHPGDAIGAAGQT